MMSGRTSTVCSAVLVIAIIGAWEVFARLELLPASQTAPASAVFGRLLELLGQPEVLLHLTYSVRRLFIGTLVGAVAGVGLACLFVVFSSLDRIMSPIVQFVAPIPGVVWIPFAIMFLGLGELSKLSLVASAVFFVVHLHAFRAMRTIDRDFVELSAIYEKTPVSRLLHVYLPHSFPSVLTALRLSLALGWIVLFVVEYGYSTPREGGLGWFISQARSLGKIEDQLAGVLLLAILGFLCDRLIVLLQTSALSWADSAEAMA